MFELDRAHVKISIIRLTKTSLLKACIVAICSSAENTFSENFVNKPLVSQSFQSNKQLIMITR